jgi:hypothetical protein
MTVMSCLALGLALAIAVALLTLAGIVLGWCGPAWVARLRGRPKDSSKPGEPPDEASGRGGRSD